jgi:hypothetical protein
MLEGRLSKERVLAKSKVKKAAVKRTVAKKVAPAPKSRPAKAAPQAKTVLKAKAAPKAKKAAKPAVAVPQPELELVVVPKSVVVAPAVEPAKPAKIQPKIQPRGQPVIQAAAPSPHCEVLTVKRQPAPSDRAAKTAQRADLPPTAGFTLLVDGHFKNQYDEIGLVKEAASKLLSKFPKLRVEIYDATTKTRMSV